MNGNKKINLEDMLHLRNENFQRFVRHKPDHVIYLYKRKSFPN